MGMGERMRRALIAVVPVALSLLWASALAEPADAVHRFGTARYVDRPNQPLVSPLDAVTRSASRTYDSSRVTKRCRAGASRPVPARQLTPNKLASLMMAITWYEAAGRTTNETPSPMTQSRNDAAGPTSLPPVSLRDSRAVMYWHPGIGMWQLDDQGLGSSYAQARFTAYSAGILARMVAERFCRAQGSLAATYAGFFACDLSATRRQGENPAERKCDRAYREIYSPTNNTMRDITPTSTTDSTGGSDFYRRCRIGRPGASESRADCTYVDVARAQESTLWKRNGSSPLASPYYVMTQRIGGMFFERRVWIVSDTNQISARRQLGIHNRGRGDRRFDSRVSTRWTDITMCDLTERTGDC